jgi:anti-sigma B factor antagonist
VDEVPWYRAALGTPASCVRNVGDQTSAERNVLSASGFPEYFRVSIEEHGDRHVVHLHGEVDLQSGPRLEELLIGVAGSDVVVVLGDVSFIDSSGIGALVRARHSIMAMGGRFTIEGPLQPNVTRVFEILGLSDLVRTPRKEC